MHGDSLWIDFLLQFFHDLPQFLDLLVLQLVVALQFLIFGKELRLADVGRFVHMPHLDGHAEIPHILAAARGAAKAQHGTPVGPVEGADGQGVVTAIVARAGRKVQFVVPVIVQWMERRQGRGMGADLVDAVAELVDPLPHVAQFVRHSVELAAVHGVFRGGADFAVGDVRDFFILHVQALAAHGGAVVDGDRIRRHARDLDIFLEADLDIAAAHARLDVPAVALDPERAAQGRRVSIVCRQFRFNDSRRARIGAARARRSRRGRRNRRGGRAPVFVRDRIGTGIPEVRADRPGAIGPFGELDALAGNEIRRTARAVFHGLFELGHVDRVRIFQPGGKVYDTARVLATIRGGTADGHRRQGRFPDKTRTERSSQVMPVSFHLAGAAIRHRQASQGDAAIFGHFRVIPEEDGVFEVLLMGFPGFPDLDFIGRPASRGGVYGDRFLFALPGAQDDVMFPLLEFVVVADDDVILARFEDVAGPYEGRLPKICPFVHKSGNRIVDTELVRRSRQLIGHPEDLRTNGIVGFVDVSQDGHPAPAIGQVVQEQLPARAIRGIRRFVQDVSALDQVTKQIFPCRFPRHHHAARRVLHFVAGAHDLRAFRRCRFVESTLDGIRDATGSASQLRLLVRAAGVAALVFNPVEGPVDRGVHAVKPAPSAAFIRDGIHPGSVPDDGIEPAFRVGPHPDDDIASAGSVGMMPHNDGRPGHLIAIVLVLLLLLFLRGNRTDDNGVPRNSEFLVVANDNHIVRPAGMIRSVAAVRPVVVPDDLDRLPLFAIRIIVVEDVVPPDGKVHGIRFPSVRMLVVADGSPVTGDNFVVVAQHQLPVTALHLVAGSDDTDILIDARYDLAEAAAFIPAVQDLVPVAQDFGVDASCDLVFIPNGRIVMVFRDFPPWTVFWPPRT